MSQFLVTGASRGIGFELTSQLLTLGHHVIGCVREPKNAKELSLLAKEYSKNCEILQMNVDDEKSVHKAVGQIGADHLDVVINCAGILHNYDATLENMNLDELHSTMQTNLYGPIHVAKNCYKLLKKSKSPRLVNITSQMGSLADNSSGNAYAYRISKCALNMLSKNIALSEKWLCTLMLHPGWVQTDMGGKNALVTPQESATGLIKIILEAKAKDSGRFLNYRGDELPW